MNLTTQVGKSVEWKKLENTEISVAGFNVELLAYLAVAFLHLPMEAL